MRRYAKNTGWLLLPVLLWNAALSGQLPRAYTPAVFDRDIPALLAAAEQALRVLVFALPFFAPFELASRRQRFGLLVFGLGLLVYVASWLALIGWPASAWSMTAAGFLAPAYTPILFLLGLAMLMQRLHWPSPYRWWLYLLLCVAFLAAHTGHAALVFSRWSGGG